MKVIIKDNRLSYFQYFSALSNLVAEGSFSNTSMVGSLGMESPLKIKGSNKMPTPGGPLTEERIKELGVIKMNEYLSSGTRPQFWEEYFVKVIMHVS